MGRRALLAWRKSRTCIFAMLLALVIAAYGAELYSGYAAGRQLRPRSDAVRIAGADAQSYAGGRRRVRSRTILLDAARRKRPAAATWVFSEYATRALRTHLASASPDLVVDAGGTSSAAQLLVKGCYTAPIRMAHDGGVFIPLSRCPIDRTLVYSVSIRVQRGAWLIRSIALQAPGHAR